MFVERDFLKRQLRQLALLIARILKLREAGQLDDANTEAQTAKRDMLGMDPERLDSLDVESVVLVLRSADRVEVYARILEQEAEILDLQGRDGDATRARVQALRQRISR